MIIIATGLAEENVEHVERLNLRVDFGYVKSSMLYLWHVHTDGPNKQAGGNVHAVQYTGHTQQMQNTATKTIPYYIQTHGHLIYTYISQYHFHHEIQ